jgi:hypothetical protein
MEQIENSGIFIYNDDSKSLYVMGDIHGDYQCLVHCLVDLCGVCFIKKISSDEQMTYPNREILQWNESCNSIVVFCGDFIHRKRFDDHVLDDECSDIFIIETLLKLKKSAKKAGGDIILISGNHEIMNILQPDENIYTSEKNLPVNTKFFSDPKFVNDYISNSYAWVKINDILIAHGGLCSDYLDYINLSSVKMHGNQIIKYVNEKYHEFFNNFNYQKLKKDNVGYNLFVEYDMQNKAKHNMFWCREWGYDSVDCDTYKQILGMVECKKMIIAHCPQFLSPEKPKMINFECKDLDSSTYNLARVDLGMSRSFDYNKHDNFIYYLTNNYNRKMAVLKLIYSNGELIFNNSSVITEQLSCIQYLLLKYGLRPEDWESKHITTNWIGFEYLKPILDSVIDSGDSNKISDFISESETVCLTPNKKNRNLNPKTEQDAKTVIMCILYPLINLPVDKIKSIVEFNNLIKLKLKKNLKN